jgi:hypothetical protein
MGVSVWFTVSQYKTRERQIIVSVQLSDSGAVLHRGAMRFVLQNSGQNARPVIITCPGTGILVVTLSHTSDSSLISLKWNAACETLRREIYDRSHDYQSGRSPGGRDKRDHTPEGAKYGFRDAKAETL